MVRALRMGRLFRSKIRGKTMEDNSNRRYALIVPSTQKDCTECHWLLRFIRFDSEKNRNTYTWDCVAHPQYANLSSFPFKNTKCADFERSVEGKFNRDYNYWVNGMR